MNQDRNCQNTFQKKNPKRTTDSLERGASGTGARSERRIIRDFEGIGGDVSKALNATKKFKTAVNVGAMVLAMWEDRLRPVFFFLSMKNTIMKCASIRLACVRFIQSHVRVRTFFRRLSEVKDNSATQIQRAWRSSNLTRLGWVLI